MHPYSSFLLMFFVLVSSNHNDRTHLEYNAMHWNTLLLSFYNVECRMCCFTHTLVFLDTYNTVQHFWAGSTASPP